MRAKIADTASAIRTITFFEQIIRSAMTEHGLLFSQGILLGMMDDIEALSRTVNHSNIAFHDKEQFSRSVHQLSERFAGLEHAYKKISGYTVEISVDKQWIDDCLHLLSLLKDSLDG